MITLPSNDFLVSDGMASGIQTLPAIATNQSDYFVIVWQDERNGWGNDDIYGQLYNLTGVPIGTNFKVNTDVESRAQSSPSAAMDGSGNFIVVWEDDRNGDLDVYAQRFSSAGDPIGVNFMVNEDDAAVWQFAPDVAMNSWTGSFVITWRDESDPDHINVLARMYDSGANPLGASFVVNDQDIYTSQPSPAIAMDGSGNFVITWEDQRDIDYDIFAQYFFSDGSFWSVNWMVGDATESDKRYPDIAMNDDGYFVITWDDERNGDRDIYAARFDTSAYFMYPPNFRVDDDEGGAWQFMPSVDMNEMGDIIFCWGDERRSNSDIFAQRYNFSDSDIDPEGANYSIPDPAYIDVYQGAPAVAIADDIIIYTWADNRQGTDNDIFAKVVTWEWTEVDDNSPAAQKPSSFELSQNYPNPFNSGTLVTFTMSNSRPSGDDPVHATLKIYNVLGQLVRTLVDEDLAPGQHQALWDGRDDFHETVTSGIYFYQLNAGEFAATRKMLFIR